MLGEFEREFLDADASNIPCLFFCFFLNHCLSVGLPFNVAVTELLFCCITALSCSIHTDSRHKIKFELSVFHSLEEEKMFLFDLQTASAV